MRGGGEDRRGGGAGPGTPVPADHFQRLRRGEDAGGHAVADADGENQRCPGKALRSESSLYQRDDRPHHGRRCGEFRYAGRHHHIGARGSDRVRRSPRDRADDQAETPGGVPARRISSGTRDGGYDRRTDKAQAHHDADSPVPGAPHREMRYPGGPRGPERIRPGLERIRAAFERTGHPERAFRTVHIAGTNGKGSTACFTDAILRRMLAEPVGLYTSPHLLSPEERIRVGGEKIPPEEFVRYGARASALSRRVAATAGEPLSYFEEMTWIACCWFRRRGIPLAVMETGLGGRWDATNLCIPEVSVITNVGKDHAEWLGTSLARIASEKAGILRENTPAILGKLAPAARNIVLAVAREKGCRVWEIDRDLRWEEPPGGDMTVHLPGISLPRMRIRMHGEFQRHNALLACAASWVVAASRNIAGTGFARAAPQGGRARRGRCRCLPHGGRTGGPPARPVFRACQGGDCLAGGEKLPRRVGDRAKMGGEKRNDHRMRVSDGGGGRLSVSRRKGRVNLRGAATAVFLACAAGSAASLWGVRPANAESAGILSEFAPKLGAGMFLGSPVTLTADTISYDEETGVALAEGNLEVGFGTQTIRADRIRYDTKTGEAEFAGHVLYEQDGDEFSFERIVLNLRSELGVLYNGRIRISSNNYQIASERFEKTGKRSFLIRKGELTTCPCEPEPDWKFGIGRSDVTIDGYAISRDVTFKIRGIPVLWFPWAAFPVKLARQSGLLLPAFSHR